MSEAIERATEGGRFRSRRADRYAESVKLDRSAMKVRNELRRAHPRESFIRAELHRARRALEALDGHLR